MDSGNAMGMGAGEVLVLLFGAVVAGLVLRVAGLGENENAGKLILAVVGGLMISFRIPKAERWSTRSVVRVIAGAAAFVLMALGIQQL